MLYKDDWEEARDGLEAWWEGTLVDRPVIMARAPRSNASPDLDGWGFARYPDRPMKVLEHFERWCSGTYFGGEAFPNLFVNLGAGVLGAILGARPRFYSNTVWFQSSMEWEDLEEVEFDSENPWWERVRTYTEKSVAEGEGKYFVSMTDLGGILDIVQSLRGKKKLMIDLFRRPEKVLDLSWKVLDIWHRCYDELYQIIQTGMKGSSAWLSIWCDGKWYPIQCDYAYMLSPGKFREFVLPFLKEQCRRLDRCVYHLDGHGQLPHLDDLLEIDDLDAIQWVPGAGKKQCGSDEYYDMYRKVKAAGKGLVLGLKPGEIRPICKELGADGILFQVTCRSEEEAKKLIENSKAWA